MREIYVYNRKKKSNEACPCGCKRIVDRTKNPGKVYFDKSCANKVNQKKAKAKKEFLAKHGGDAFMAGL